MLFALFPSSIIRFRRWCSAAGEVTGSLAESNGSLPPGLWLGSPAGWLPRTPGSALEPYACFEYGTTFTFLSVWCDCDSAGTDGVRRKLPTACWRQIFSGGQRATELHRAAAAFAVKGPQGNWREFNFLHFCIGLNAHWMHTISTAIFF